MTELLEKYGFTYRGTCNCAGPKTLRYKRGDYKIEWNKKAKKFRLKHHGKPITILLDEAHFEGEIKKYFPTEIGVQTVSAG